MNTKGKYGYYKLAVSFYIYIQTLDVAVQKKVDRPKKELLKDLNLLKVNGKIILRRNNYGHA